MIKKYSQYREKFIRIFKYIFSSGSSFVIDLGLFSLINYIFKNIFLATVLARIISSLYNYIINSRYVFKNYNKKSIYKYYLLVIVQMFMSYIFVSLGTHILKSINATIIKFFVDIIIFIVNYIIQKEVVFK